MRKIQPIRAAVTTIFIVLTAQWFIRREKSLIGKLISSLGGGRIE